MALGYWSSPGKGNFHPTQPPYAFSKDTIALSARNGLLWKYWWPLCPWCGQKNQAFSARKMMTVAGCVSGGRQLWTPVLHLKGRTQCFRPCSPNSGEY